MNLTLRPSMYRRRPWAYVACQLCYQSARVLVMLATLALIAACIGMMG